VNGELADRPPVSAWRHFIGHETSAEDLAAATTEFQRKYDWDFVKINPRAVCYTEAWGNEYDYSKYTGFAPTCTRYILHTVKDLGKIDELSADQGALGEQLVAIRLIREKLGDDVPLLQTIFSPLAVLLNLCGTRIIGRYREAPRNQSPLVRLFAEDRDGAHRALKAIANTLAAYAAATLDAGADGAFYTSLGIAREGYLTLEEWEQFARPYDLIVLEALESTPTILHTCGIYSNPQRFVDYPIKILHWAESALGNPSIAASADWIGGKAVMGGVDERYFGTGAPDKIAESAGRAVRVHAERSFVLAPECSVSPSTFESEFWALRTAV
jgi:uroporphyrinogen decarboxylase